MKSLNAKQKKQIYLKYEIVDWAKAGGTEFYLRGNSSIKPYSLESLRPVIEDLSPQLKHDLDEINSYHKAGNWALYSAGGLAGLAALGYANKSESVYHTGQNLSLLSLFTWIIFEQFEWQLKGQVQFQFNDGLKERIGIDDSALSLKPLKQDLTPEKGDMRVSKVWSF